MDMSIRLRTYFQLADDFSAGLPCSLRSSYSHLEESSNSNSNNNNSNENEAAQEKQEESNGEGTSSELSASTNSAGDNVKEANGEDEAVANVLENTDKIWLNSKGPVGIVLKCIQQVLLFPLSKAGTI